MSKAAIQPLSFSDLESRIWIPLLVLPHRYLRIYFLEKVDDY